MAAHAIDLAWRIDRAPSMAFVRAVPPRDHSPECVGNDSSGPSESARVANRRRNREVFQTHAATSGWTDRPTHRPMEANTPGRAASHGWRSLRSAGGQLDRMDGMDTMDTNREALHARRAAGVEIEARAADAGRVTRFTLASLGGRVAWTGWT